MLAKARLWEHPLPPPKLTAQSAESSVSRPLQSLRSVTVMLRNVWKGVVVVVVVAVVVVVVAVFVGGSSSK